MVNKPTYERLEQMVKELEEEVLGLREVEKDLRIFKTAVESSINAIGITDLDGKIIYVNDSCVKMWGYNNKDEILGRFLSEFWAGDDIFKTIKELSDKGVASGEDVGKRKDGSLFFVQFTASVFRDDAGKPSFMFGSFFDITEQKHSEEALRESEEQFRELAELLPETIFEMDLNGFITFVNRNAFKFFGYTQDDFDKGLTALQMLIPEDRDKAADNIQKRLKGAKIDIQEYTALRKDGGTFPISIHSTPVIRDNTPIGLRGIIVNIAHRKQVEKALRESENRFRSLVESSPIGMCIIQKNQIVYQNRSMKSLLGSLPKEYENLIPDYLHPDDVEKCKRVYRQITSGRKQTSDIDFRFYPFGKKDTIISLRWVQCHASLVEYQGMDAILMNMMDITRVKEIEHLLSIKQKMSSLGHVAAGIAHEIRNPLTGINSYLYTLKDLCDSEIIDGDQNVMIKHIISQFQLASDKIEAVIKRVLDFSRPNPPKMNLIDPIQCIENTLKLSSATLSKCDIKLEKSMEPDLPQFYGDFHLIEQVLLNLINNATRVMQNSKKDKRIRIDSFRKNKSLYIQVSDSGPGIPKEIKDQIFDPFFTTSPDGTGIGLSIAQRIIADHHGTIEILQSKWGGSTFRIKLPIEKRTLSR